MTTEEQQVGNIWEVCVPRNELIDVSMMVRALNRPQDESAIVWLTKVPRGPRLWIVRDSMVAAWLTCEGSPSDPTDALPIPEAFIAHLIHITEGESEITLLCNSSDGTIIGRTPHRSIATDQPIAAEFTAFDLPYRAKRHGQHDNPAVATVAVSDLHLFGKMAHDIPRGFDITRIDGSAEQIYPFVSVALKDNSMAWTSDWRRVGLGRTTAVVPASTTGAITAMFYPYPVARLLLSKDPHGDAQIFIGGPDAEHVYFVGSDWGMRVEKEFEEIIRWRPRLIAGIKAAGFEMGGYPGRLAHNQYSFTALDIVCFASIHVDDDSTTEFIRLTSIVVDGVEGTLGQLSRINEINQGLVGARVYIRNGEVHVVAQFPASLLPDCKHQFETFATAAKELGEMLEFLPLFTQDAADLSDS